MKIILNEEIIGLGDEGDIVNVADGYARNFLFPQKKARSHNIQNISVLEGQRKAINKRREERRVEYLSLKEKIEEISLVIKMKTGESGHLYGAVTSTIIAEKLEEQGVLVQKKQIVVPHHSIREVGDYTVDVKLQSTVSARLKVGIEDMEGRKDFFSKNEELELASESTQEGEDIMQDAEIQSTEQQDADAPHTEQVEQSTEQQDADVQDTAQAEQSAEQQDADTPHTEQQNTEPQSTQEVDEQEVSETASVADPTEHTSEESTEEA